MIAPAAVLFAAAVHVSVSDDNNAWWLMQQVVAQPIWILYLLVIAALWIYQAFAKKDRDAALMLAGSIFVVIGFVLDLATSLGFINFPFVLSFLFAFFILSLALILTNRFVRLNQEVEDLNENLERKVEQRTRQLNETLTEVQSLKEKQDGDYYLTSLLIKPLGGNHSKNASTGVEISTRQFKRFTFRKWSAEIGGDLSAAYDLVLKGRPYTVFMNGDAMGKSVQGAGGAIVLGTVFKSLVHRTQFNPDAVDQFPEQWLKLCFLELQTVFLGFDGYMLASAIIGLIDQQNGMLYFINAEHPQVVVFRDGAAQFVPDSLSLRKLGMVDPDGALQVLTWQMDRGDILICGSDGRDDLQIGASGASRTINEDEHLFVRIVEESRAELDEIWRQLQKAGGIIDDLSLLRLAYCEDAARLDESQAKPRISAWLNQARNDAAAGRFEAALEPLEMIVSSDPENADALGMLGDACRRSGRYGEAADWYERYLDCNPSDSQALYAAALCLKRDGQFARAADAGECLRLRSPDHVKNALNLAEIYFRMANRDRARKLLDWVLAREPSNAAARRLANLLRAPVGS